MMEINAGARKTMRDKTKRSGDDFPLMQRCSLALMFLIAISVLLYATPAVTYAWLILPVEGFSDNAALTGSMAVDGNGKLHLAYEKTDKTLQYATNASGSWVVTLIDSNLVSSGPTKLVVDTVGKIHIGYIGIGYSVKYATNASGVWVCTTVDNTSIDNYGGVGYADLAVDKNGMAHMSYSKHIYSIYYLDTRLVCYATNMSGQWEVTTVMDPPGNYGNAYITVDADQKAHIFCTHAGSLSQIYIFKGSYSSLNYATNVSGQWAGYGLNDNYDFANEGLSSPVEHNGKIYISFHRRPELYSDTTSYRDLHYKEIDPHSVPSVSWTDYTVDSTGDVGGASSIAVDQAGKVHIGYYDSTNSALKYATNAVGSWNISTIVYGSPNAPNADPQLIVDDGGYAHVYYHEIVIHTGSPNTTTLYPNEVTNKPTPIAIISATSLSFGNQLVNSVSTSQTITITNSGTGPLTITDISIVGVNPTQFMQSNNCPDSLAAGVSCIVDVSFSPSSIPATGVMSASLAVNVTAPAKSKTVLLNGSVARPVATVAPATAVFGYQLINTTSTAQTVTVNNTGALPLMITEISVGGANLTQFIQTNNCPASLAAGTSCTVRVTFNPTIIPVTELMNAVLAVNVASPATSQSVPLSGKVDITVPVITAFTLPATGRTSLVNFTTLTATDNVGVAAWCVTESSNSADCVWSVVKPTSSTLTGITNGTVTTKTIYVRVRDAAGNISLAITATITIDAAVPTISSFSLPVEAGSLSVPITVFTATDNPGVTGYLITTTTTTPSATATGWSTIAPTTYTFPSTGNKILYAWAKDAAGNISVPKNAAIAIDAAAPNITVFDIPTESGSFTIPITTFTASDNFGVTGYLITATTTTPSATATGWSTIAPTAYAFSSTGSKTLYAWVKDTVGNISLPKSATVAIEASAPIITAFTLPGTSASLTVPITTFTATDNYGVTGYLITLTTTTPSATATGWSVIAPTTYTFSSTGNKTLYAWTKDAVGNISAPNSATVAIETSAPIITAFTLPATSASLIVPITTFTATDNYGVTGYLITLTTTTPSTTATGWSVIAPTTYTFSSMGSKTLYAWVKDAVGNISSSQFATVTIDISAPIITDFTIPASVTSQIVTITKFTATDNVGVTGYLITENAIAPASTSTQWMPIPPSTYTSSQSGTITLYAWVIDAAGNISAPCSVSFLPGKSFIVNPMISAGAYHTLALRNDGMVWAWGFNGNGELGDGTTFNRTTPVHVSGMSNAIAISAGYYHTVALKNDGTVWAWGKSNYGQLGDGTTNNRSTPVQVSGMGNVIAIAASGYHTVALKNDGTVWAWGYNNYGQLGDGTAINRSTPVQVSGMGNVIAISAGMDHTVVLKNDGTVWAWGNNGYGELGDGTTINRSTPVQVIGMSNMTAISAGYYHAVALKNDGTVWAWGFNYSGQLGDGTTINRTLPVQVSGMNNMITISAGVNHTAALKNDGTVWAWGYNGYGQLGDGTATNRVTPVLVNGMGNVITISAGCPHTVAFKNDGTVWGWGYNGDGELGDGTTSNRITPVQASISIMPMPIITSFTIPATTDSALVSINAVSATDDNGIMDWCVTESSLFTGCSWSSMAPNSFAVLGVGETTTVTKTLYFFVQDADGNVSSAVSGAVTITTVNQAPQITAFVIPSIVGLNVPITTFVATDNSGVTGYLITESSVTPSAAENGWSVIAPTIFTSSGGGNHTLYAWVKDEVGNISSPATASANVITTKYNIAASAGTNGSLSSSGTTTLNYGDNQAYTITPATGYHVASVLVDGASVGAVTSYSFSNVTANHTISATFAINAYTITASAGTNGSLSSSGTTTLNYGDNQAYTVTPSTGYHVADVLVDGASVGAVTSYSFNNVTANHTLSATFAINAYTITASAGTNGSITSSGTTTLNYGDNQAYTITPATGYHVASVLVDGASVGAVTSYSFSNVTANHMISATFAINAYTIATSVGANGSFDLAYLTLPQIVSYGSSTSFKFDAATNYHVAAINGCGISYTNNSNAIITYTATTGVIASDCVVNATFAINQYPITAIAEQNGNISPNLAQLVSAGSTTAFTVTPNAGYHIDIISGCSGTLAGDVYTTGAIVSECTVSASFTINDTAAPILTLSTLADNSYTNNASLNVAGTVSDNLGVTSLLVSGVSVTVNPDNSFSHLVTLQTGTNTITTIAADEAGNQTTDTRNIILDQAVPPLTVSGPADNSKTNQAESTVTGIVEANATVNVKINNGIPALALMSGETFTYSATLSAGLNSIAITAIDLAGNTASVNRTVIFDNAAPSIAITSPNQDGTNTTGSIQLQGTVIDALTAATVVISDGTQTYTPTVTNGTFQQTISFSAEGKYVITVTATDEAGNSSSVQRNILYIKLGDLDSSGDVTAGDALRALRIAAGLIQQTDIDLQRGDVAPMVNGIPQPDGILDIGDVVVILRKAAGLISW